MTQDNTTTERKRTTTTERTRPRWAQIIRHLGEDVTWAIEGWCGFPRACTRVFAAVVGAGAGWLVGLDDAAAQLVQLIGG